MKFWLASVFMAFASLATATTVLHIPVEGAIGAATAQLIEKAFAEAEDQKAALIVIEMNTPGGLDSAMRDIIKTILASDIPVALFVSPSGSRAASAGTYILYASHIAAMTPVSTLGAATPVSLGGDGDSEEKDGEKQSDDSDSAMRRKVINDAAAYIRSLAEQRERNVEWAEKAVREAVSLSAEEALKEDVIEYIAADLDALLKALNGQTIKINSEKTVTLDLDNVRIETFTPDWRLKFLAAISDPSIAYILLMLGIYGIVFEFLSPGFGVSGTLGAIFLLTALFGLQMLPINYAGFAFIFLGMALLIAELFLPTFGLLGFGGLVSFILGSILLFDSNIPGFEVPYVTIFSTAISLFLLFLFVAFYVVRNVFGTSTTVSGNAQILHSVGEAIEDFQGEGRIRLLGESWRAHSQVFIKRGQKVKILAKTGLLLEVAPVEATPAESEINLSKS